VSGAYFLIFLLNNGLSEWRRGYFTTGIPDSIPAVWPVHYVIGRATLESEPMFSSGDPPTLHYKSRNLFYCPNNIQVDAQLSITFIEGWLMILLKETYNIGRMRIRIRITN
jgi:hypothetical protein